MTKEIIIPTNPKDLERLGRLVQDGVDCLTRISGERDEMKTITDLCKEDFKLPPKFINKMIRTKYKGDIDKQEVEHDDFVELYEKVVK